MDSIGSVRVGKGYPIVLLHGFCETKEIWWEFGRELSLAGYDVIAPDLPGFGSSPLGELKSIDEIGNAIREWLDSQGIKKPVLVGHSLGGYVALAMAAAIPDAFPGLVLFHSTIFEDSEERKNNRNRIIDFVGKHGVEPYIETFVPGLFADPHQIAIPAFKSIAMGTKANELLAYTAIMRDRPSREEFVKSYRGKVLVIGGDLDTIIPPNVARQISELAPMGFLCVLEQTAHMGMYESPGKAIGCMVDFFKIATLE